ncbi:MAG TPA: hypothetical protein VNO30_42850 [Kofleriaceae bacterium]|nr:hypothetical protein [Kofleriaceae bacterium]
MTIEDLDRATTTLHGEMHVIRDDLRGEMHAIREDLRGEMHVIRDELRGEMHAIRDELRGEMHVIRDELRGEMHVIRDELRGEMRTMKTDLIREMGVASMHVANVMMEQIRSLVAVVEEKYQDLPPAHAKLRADFDAHAADYRLHAPLPPAAPKRTRRSRPR